MLGIILFLYGLYCIFRSGFHYLLGGPLSHVTGMDVGGSDTGCWYTTKGLIAVALASFCGLAGI